MTASDPSRPAPSLWARLAARLGTAGRDESRPRRSKEERDQVRLEGRAQRSENKRQADEAREARRREEAARREEARLQYERALDAAYAHSTRVRGWLTSVRGRAPELPLGDAERRMAVELAPLWDADRATIATLRRWCDPLRGAPSPAESEPSPSLMERMRRQVTVLRKQSGGGALLVPEVATLGVGGAIVGDQLHSEDSLNFAFAGAALKDAAVLSALRESPVRRVVWEIGGGWGGFGYHLKTLCPNVTYLITGIPERLLVSAVYLMSVFPGARVRLHGESGAGDTWADWEQVDFVFAVEGTTGGMRPPRLDLTVDLNELRHMPAARVAQHVEQAFEWGSPYFYSVLPWPLAQEPCTPWSAIERRYWPHPVPRFAERSMAYARTIPPESDFAYLMGWRRLRT